ncbi:MAG: oxidoreductase [Patulibacter sp.]|nr:oxidoreductase [Patulibacter sp.]
MSSSWSTNDIPSQAGRLAIVTGGNSGIGFEAAKALAIAGAEVILATRSEEKGNAAVAEIQAAAPGATVTREALDLSDLSTVEAFASGRKADGRPIDLLINNGGIMAVPNRELTTDGFELQLGTNFLGHFALTGQLLDLVLAAPRPRVVTVTSTAALMGKITLDDLQLEQGYKPWVAYGQSKLATSMLAIGLAKRADTARWNLLSTAAHPGLAKSNLQTTGPGRNKEGVNLVDLFVNTLPSPAQSSAAGALPTLRAAIDPAAKPGQLFGPRLFMLRGAPVNNPHARRAKDHAVIDALFAKAEELTGVTWPAAVPATT